jgi:hypothetical protein
LGSIRPALTAKGILKVAAIGVLCHRVVAGGAAMTVVWLGAAFLLVVLMVVVVVLFWPRE